MTLQILKRIIKISLSFFTGVSDVEEENGLNFVKTEIKQVPLSQAPL